MTTSYSFDELAVIFTRNSHTIKRLANWLVRNLVLSFNLKAISNSKWFGAVTGNREVQRMSTFSFWGVMENEFEFGCVKFGLMDILVLLSGRLIAQD